jgi:hypothetical protein
VTVSAHDDFLSAGDVPEVSGIRNTIAAQEFGADLTDYYRSRGVTVGITAGDFAGARWSVALDRDQQTPLAVHAKPVSGSFQPAFAADSVTDWRATLSAFHARSDAPFGSSVQLAASISGARTHFDAAARAGYANWTGRISLNAQIERPFGADYLELETTVASVLGAGSPAQDLVYFGGPVTGPGYGYHALSGSTGLSQRVEWRHPAWSFPVPLGRFGSLRMPVTLAPFLQGIWINGSGASAPTSDGWHESAGLGVLTLFDALRFDVARGLRNGKWFFGVDFARGFWRIL